MHFTLGFSEEEILKRLASTEKVVLVALYMQFARTTIHPEELAEKKIRGLCNNNFSKRNLVKELMQLVTLVRVTFPVLKLSTG